MKHQTSNSNRKCLDCSDFVAGLPRLPFALNHNLTLNLNRSALTALCCRSSAKSESSVVMSSVFSTLRSVFPLRLKFSGPFFSSASFPSLPLCNKSAVLFNFRFLLRLPSSVICLRILLFAIHNSPFASDKIYDHLFPFPFSCCHRLRHLHPRNLDCVSRNRIPRFQVLFASC
jgi:hypothetical protein